MEQIVVQIRDKEKAKALFELLSALDFVESVEASETEAVEADATGAETLDFFSLAGLWQDRDISLDLIRQQAWPRQHS
jgi:hypothetical protein